MCKKLKELYKRIPIAAVGVTAFLAIILLLTIIFNWYWSGLGDDPTHYFKLPLTTDKEEFKDYATLYIALLSFGAALFAALAVFLVFNDWKVQHNATVYSNLALESLNNFKKLNYYLVSFKDLEINLEAVMQNNFIDQNKKREAVIAIYDNYIDNRKELDSLKSIFLHDIIFISQLVGDAKLLASSLAISTKIQNQLNTLNEFVKNNSTTLNNNQLLQFIANDNTIFCEIGLKSTKIILPLLQKYIQQ